MDSFNFKKFTSDAGTLFNRAVQYTGEKLGGAEKTELDAHFENLLQRADSTRQWTERILAQTETLLQPNPNVRMESFLYEKLEKAKRDRQTNFEVLGQCMIDSGNDFGPGTSYGNALVKCGQTEQKMGMAEKEFHAAATNNFLIPLKTFLEGDMKTLQKERKVLEGKRLDLDAAKGRLRKAKAQAAQQAAEAELRVAQSEFDRQGEITKLLLEGISSTHAHHLRCLNDFIEAQMTYFAQCQQYMQDLQRQLGSYNVGGSSSSLSGGVGGGSGGNNPSATSPSIRPPLYSNLSSSNPGGATVSPSAPPANAESAPSTSPSSGTRRARVLYDYDAGDMKELSLQADEIIDVYNLPGLDSDWMIGERTKGGSIQRGKVPVTYLELID